ncbi:MAG: transporter, family, cyanate transporter [Nocardioidaceae bacterium]|nr:transporter, family, cyanate transporter [Nocardioidaceae bacterium]
MAAEEQTHQDTRLQRALVVTGVLVLAFNLRPAAVSVGPVLAEVTSGLHMNHVEAGVLTALPVVAFGAFGAVAPAAARVAGVHRVTLGSLLALVAGLVVRATTSSVPLFLVMSVVALAGMATANVLLPSLVKQHFPDHVGFFTALYTTSLAIGLTSASVLTVPLAHGLGSWRWGIGSWALVAGVAAIPWVFLVRRDSAPSSGGRRRIPLRDVARTRLGWAMALLFGLQSAQAYTIFGWFAQVYRDAGFSATTAGLLLGVVTGISIPLSFWVPVAAGRTHNQTRLMLLLVGCYPIGYLGLMLIPRQGAWAWALLVGIGASVFPVVLTLIGLRSRTPDGTAALSGFTQSVGYGIAAVGPFGIGVLYDATGGWTWPLIVLIVISLVTAWLATIVGKPLFIEDQLTQEVPAAA